MPVGTSVWGGLKLAKPNKRWYIKDGHRYPVVNTSVRRETSIFNHVVDPKKVGALSMHADNLAYESDLLKRYVDTYVSELTGRGKRNAKNDAMKILEVIKRAEFELESVKSAFTTTDRPCDDLSTKP